MAITTTRWSPDTCACVVEYSWDTSTSEDQRVHTPHAVIQRCARHAAHQDSALHAALMDENPRKNRLLGRLQVLFPAAFDKDGLFLGSWAFDAQHVLRMSLPGVTALQKTAAQNWADSNLGGGKAIIS